MKVQKWMVLALFVPLVLAAFSGTAVAQNQQVNIQLNCQGGPAQIQPLGAPGSWNCVATPQVTLGIGEPATFVTVNLQASDAPTWANVIIAPASLSFQYDQGSQSYQPQNFQISIALTQDAPAFQATKVTVGGSATAGHQAQQVGLLTTQLTVTPGYFNLYNVRVDQKIGRGGPQDSVTYPIVIDNFSNGDTRFEFALATEATPAGFQPVVPEPVVLQSRATGGKTTSGQVSFQVYTPYRNGYVNDIGALQLRVDSFYAPNTNIKGASSQVSTLTQARGFYVPGVEAPLVVLGILGSAVAMSALRRND